MNTRPHHIQHDLKTGKIYSIELIISENLAMSYEHHLFNLDVFLFFINLFLPEEILKKFQMSESAL